MKQESLRSLYQIKSLVDQDRQFKRYMRLNEAERNYQMDRRMLFSIAKECGAYDKINSVCLIEMDTFEKYFDERFKVNKEDEE